MTEDTKDGPNQVAQDQSAPPMPTGDSAGSGGGSSADQRENLSSVLDRIDRLEQSLDDKIDARFKSGQDRNVSRLERDIDQLRDIVTKAGGDFNKVETEVRISDLSRQVEELSGGNRRQAAPGRAGLSPQWVEAQAETEIILDENDIPNDDPDYVSFMSRYAGRVRPEAWPGLVKSWAAKRKKQQQSQSGAAFDDASRPPADSTSDELMDEYEKKRAQIPRGDVSRLHSLQTEYRKKGLQI